MALEILLKKLNGTLCGADTDSEEALHGVPEGEIIKATITRPRNVQHHRKMFALLKVVHEAQSLYPTVTHLLDAIKIAIGHFDQYLLPNGEKVCRPRSIAFHAMDQKDFTEFYDRAVRIILESILPGVARDDLDNRVAAILDGNQPVIGRRIFKHQKKEAA